MDFFLVGSVFMSVASQVAAVDRYKRWGGGYGYSDSIRAKKGDQLHVHAQNFYKSTHMPGVPRCPNTSGHTV